MVRFLSRLLPRPASTSRNGKTDGRPAWRLGSQALERSAARRGITGATMNTIKTFTDAELATLSISFRNALTAHVCNNRRYVDIAADQGIPVGTVRSRINRARAKIAKLRGAEAKKAAA